MKKYNEVKIEIEVEELQEKVWDVLYNNFGDVSKWNPIVEGSGHIGGDKGEVGCERVCEFDPSGKNSIKERIVAERNGESFDVEIFHGGLPMMKELKATIDAKAVGSNRTKVTFNMFFISSFNLMSFMQKKMIKKMMTEVTIGLKFYLETGMEVNKHNIKLIVKAHKKNERRHIKHFDVLQAA